MTHDVPGRSADRVRTLSVEHETVYQYTSPVRSSTHTFRLRPAHDDCQAVLAHTLTVTPPGARWPFDDLFGNQADHYQPHEAFTEMRIVSRATVRLWAPPALAAPPHYDLVLPLVWPPSQQRVIQPFLNAPELSPRQLRTLSDYADSFAERNNYDLIASLTDVAATIHRDFQYTPGVTSLQTTPYEVLETEHGVCQDFANLFISLARLLGVPARYRVGYIFTGADYANREQGDQSHAWAECYLPGLGWRGFDPTNGCTVGADHVRVSCGRNYLDATPTSGTIFEGGGGESLRVHVRVEEVASVDAAG